DHTPPQLSQLGGSTPVISNFPNFVTDSHIGVTHARPQFVRSTQFHCRNRVEHSLGAGSTRADVVNAHSCSRDTLGRGEFPHNQWRPVCKKPNSCSRLASADAIPANGAGLPGAATWRSSSGTGSGYPLAPAVTAGISSDHTRRHERQGSPSVS